MDLEAVKQSSDDLLKSLGLNCSGDILNLRRFCQQQNKSGEDNDNKDRKRKLLEAFLEKRKGKKSSKSKVAEKEKTKKIQLGWMHFDQEKNKFVSVRLAKGGGTRDVEVLASASKEHLINEAELLFFPNGYNEIAGPASEVEFGSCKLQRQTY